MEKIGYLLYSEDGSVPTFFEEGRINVEEYPFNCEYTIKRIVYF